MSIYLLYINKKGTTFVVYNIMSSLTIDFLPTEGVFPDNSNLQSKAQVESN
jgi:hypothetical protein